MAGGPGRHERAVDRLSKWHRRGHKGLSGLGGGFGSQSDVSAGQVAGRTRGTRRSRDGRLRRGGHQRRAVQRGDSDEAGATAETEEAEAPVGPYGDPERAKEFDLSKESMNTLLNCPLNVRVFASVCSLFLLIFESTGGDKEDSKTHVVIKIPT